MKFTRVYVLLAGLLLILAACGRVPGTGANGSPSPAATAAESPSAQPTPLTIPGPTLHNGEVGLDYPPVTYTATGGTDGYVWTVSAGALPGGLTLSQGGTIGGTPTAAGTFSFTIEVTDAAMATAHVGGQLTIVSQLSYRYLNGMTHNEMEVCTSGGKCPGCTWIPPAPRYCPYPPQDDRYLPFAQVGGGAAPYTYALVSGTPPPQTHLNGLALAGTYVAVRQAFQFTVRVTDSMGAAVDIAVTYNVYFTTAG